MSREENFENSTEYYIRRMSSAMTAVLSKCMSDFGLTPAQSHILAYLFDSDDTVTQRSIEKFFNLSHATVIGTLRRMEKAGFVKVTVNERDHRQRDVLLTEKSLKMRGQMLKARRDIQNRMRDRLPKDVYDAIPFILKTVYETLCEEGLGCEK